MFIDRSDVYSVCRARRVAEVGGYVVFEEDDGVPDIGVDASGSINDFSGVVSDIFALRRLVKECSDANTAIRIIELINRIVHEVARNRSKYIGVLALLETHESSVTVAPPVNTLVIEDDLELLIIMGSAVVRALLTIEREPELTIWIKMWMRKRDLETLWREWIDTEIDCRHGDLVLVTIRVRNSIDAVKRILKLKANENPCSSCTKPCIYR